MICTSNYSNKFNPKVRVVSISGDKGKDANFEGECYPALAPKKGFWEIWHKNIGKRSPKENNTYYIEEYYKQVLANLDPYEVYNDLDGAILLCYEKEKDFCHRQIVAAWFELFMPNVIVPEIKVIGHYMENKERPLYPKIKAYLEECIKQTINIEGYDDIKSWYWDKSKPKLKELGIIKN
jgi:hypothetical protein